MMETSLCLCLTENGKEGKGDAPNGGSALGGKGDAHNVSESPLGGK